MTAERIDAKARYEQERSDAIVVSFDAVWYNKLKDATFSAIIRKRVPSSSRPKWLYFHINAPVGAICGRAPILEIRKIGLREALSLKRRLDLKGSEIERYVGTGDKIGLYLVGKIEIPRREVTTVAVNKRLIYHPPQSFLVLSVAGKENLDDMCQFDKS